MDLTDQALSHGLPAAQVLRDQVERIAVIEQLPHIVRPRQIHGFARPNPLRSAFDVRRCMRLDQERPLTHAPHPILRQRRRLQEPRAPARSAVSPASDAVADVEARRRTGRAWLELAAEGAVLEGGEEGVELGEGRALGGSEFFDGGDAAGKGLLDGYWRKAHWQLPDDAHIQPCHDGSLCRPFEIVTSESDAAENRHVEE